MSAGNWALKTQRVFSGGWDPTVFPLRLGALTLAALLLVIAGGLPGEAQTITEINPSQSTLWAIDPDGASGGRVNHLGVAPTNKYIIFAASEWGGIYKSIDGGQTWARMNGHLPTVTWDVKVSPTDSNRVIATSFYDGRVNSRAGINVSTDGGVTWTHPALATPPANFCLSAAAPSEPAGYGISFDLNQPNNVYVGTNCGLAISKDAGNSWHYVDPTPADPADNVWSVAVHHGGIIDTCGDDGHRRSTDGGSTWTSTSGNGLALPAGICSITASPDESYVLFAVVGTMIYESDDGGGSWIYSAYTNPPNPNSYAQGRIPFVKTNSRGTGQYDLWFGDVSVYRGSCTTPSPAAPGGSQRCQASSSWAGGFTRSHGAHDDMGDVALDPAPGQEVVPKCLKNCESELRICELELHSQLCNSGYQRCVSNCPKIQLNACPLAMSSDGGVFVNTVLVDPACQTPHWAQPQVTPHGLWLFGMDSAHAASGAGVSLYLGNQDDGTFAATDAQTTAPTWFNRDCCDGFDMVADINQVVYTLCCFGPPVEMFLRNTGMTGGSQINTYPVGRIWSGSVVDRFGSNEYVLLTDGGVFITINITANPIAWSPLGARGPDGACAVHAALSGSTPSFFVQAGSCTGSQLDQIWRYDGTGTNGTWTQVNLPSGFLGFGIFAVDKQNPNRLFASVLSDSSGVAMELSTDGGASWSDLSTLDAAMTGNGVYVYKNSMGPTDFTGFGGYAQPTLVAFSPFDSQTLVAAGADSGVFLSRDSGATWTTVTDNSGAPGNQQVPRAKFASFDQNDGTYTTFIGTQGRGVWKFETCSAGLTLCSETCVNTFTNAQDCGACGRSCATGASCTQGKCGCPPGTLPCCDLGCRAPGKCPKLCP